MSLKVLKMIFSIKENTLTAYGIIWDGDGMEFVSVFTQMESQYEKIIVKLHTYGGSVFDGNLIHNVIQNSKKDIEIHIVGIAASMGAVISLSRAKVYMVENGFLMTHSASGTTRGNALDHETTAKLLTSIDQNFEKKLIKKTGKPAAYVKKWLVSDTWFDANQALKEGLITGIIEAETPIEKMDPQSLGLTETYNRFAALLIPTNVQVQTNENNTMKKPMIEALALVGVTEQSSDTAVIEAVKLHYEAKQTALQGELQKEKDLRIAAEKKVTDQAKAVVDTLIADAKTAGKITVDQVATFEAIAEKSGVEALKVVLNTIQARRSITGQMSATGKTDAPEGSEAWNWDKWQKEDPKGLEALSKETPEAFTALYNQKYKK